MAFRSLKIAAGASSILFAMTASLVFAGFFLNPQAHHVSCSDDFHVGVRTHGLDARLVLFNHGEYGPYVGSLIGILDGDGNVYPPREHEEAFGDFAGIYYRYFQWADTGPWPDTTLWTVMVSLWYPLAIFAIIPVWRFRRWMQQREMSQDRRNTGIESQTHEGRGNMPDSNYD